ncbi:UNVERIFIED_CONTAM: hypothetical protein K2H54_047551 [Gekko kuhli]
MDFAKVRGCLAVSILLLLLLEDDASACYCRYRIALSTAFCTSDVVIGGSFVDARFEREDRTWAIYGFKVKDVFRGPVNAGEKVDLYTQLLGTTCGYRHVDHFSEDEYVVTGPSLPLRHFSLAVSVDYRDLTDHGVFPGCKFGLPCQ